MDDLALRGREAAESSFRASDLGDSYALGPGAECLDQSCGVQMVAITERVRELRSVRVAHPPERSRRRLTIR